VAFVAEIRLTRGTLSFWLPKSSQWLPIAIDGSKNVATCGFMQEMPERRHTAPVQINLRVSSEMADALDAWLANINEERWPKINRSDVQRALLEWALEARPSFGKRGLDLEPLARLEGPGGQVLAEMPLPTGAGPRVTFQYGFLAGCSGQLSNIHMESGRVVAVYDLDEEPTPKP